MMRSIRRKWTIILWGATIVWCLFCWFLSAQDLETTAHISVTATQFLIKTFGLPGSIYMTLHNGLRSAAHMVVFFVLSVLMCMAFCVTFTRTRRRIIPPFLCCCLIAIVDEIHKLFVYGRHCSIFDMGTNIVACILGAFASTVCYKQWVKRYGNS